MALIRHLLLVLTLVINTFPACAMDVETLPEVLRPWIPWVLADYPEADCPFFYQNFKIRHCSWPGPLKLELNDHFGRFSSEWTLYKADWLILPGDQNHWPQHVMLGQKPAVVIEHLGKPSIWLSAGHYQISGEYVWNKLPESLVVADDTGLIELSVNEKNINYPHIEHGAIWLGQQENQENNNQQDRLDLQVFRQIIDDNPLQIITRLTLNVSGVAREISLQHAMLPEFIPVSLNSPLPAKIEHDGKLLIQVRPGQWVIDIHARHPRLLSQLDLAIKDKTWPESEIWAFRAMPAVRLVEIKNQPTIDASQTGLSQEWQQLPAYQIKQGQGLQFKVIRRGDEEQEPNKLSLKRKLWLDFDGKGYTVSDHINGKMTRDWRINALTQTQLGQVLLNGKNQLITQIDDDKQGVEVRRGNIEMQADSRITNEIGNLNAVGWQQSFQRVQAELNIPPGWRLLAVSGVDNDPDSWLTRWTLLDIFLVLIIALAVSRLWSWHWGVIALLSLMLCWHEADAPQWVWLNTLAALALLRILPENRFSGWVTWYRNLCWLGLVIIVVPFMITQIRMGIYPQLEKPWQSIDAEPYVASAVSIDEVAAGMSMEMSEAPAPEIGRKMNKAYSAVAEYKAAAVNFDQVDLEANVQTGPGLPQWQWQTVQLSWNGTVDSQQQIKLWYLSPKWTLVMHFMQALLVALMSLKVLGLVTTRWRLTMPGLSVWLLLPVVLMLPNTDSFADIPDPQLLEQLKTRLLKAPECLPACAEIASMKLTSTPNEMLIDLQVHAQQDVAIPLPAQMDQWLPEQVGVDGKQTNSVIRKKDGHLWLALNKGVHKVLLYGRHNQKFKFSLPLPLKPQHSELKIEGWRVEGLYENNKTAAQLEFSRVSADPQFTKPLFQENDLAAFVRVERTLHLGLDWRVTTRVVRLAGSVSPVVLQIPLLPGEAITSDLIHIENGSVLVNLPAGQNSMEWNSLLEKREQIELQASETTQWSEVWRADVSPIWHLQTTGLSVVHHQDQKGAWLPEWRPWPGEKVVLDVSRPQPVSGPTLTIDKSQLNLQSGKRNQVANLMLSVRSSKGGQHHIILPAHAELQSVSIDGVTQPIRQKADKVTLPIRPGAQQITLNWLEASEQTMLLTTPMLNLGVNSVNSHIQVTLGGDRWVLFTLGPQFGPAVLIWGLLLVLLLLAIGLGKSELTPLKHWQWFLLLIGLSQIHVAAGLTVVLWLFALGIRGRNSEENINRFNLGQMGLGLLTLISVLLLFASVQQGLLGSPDMQIMGNQSTAGSLNWYQDYSGPALPTAIIVSAPMMLYRLLMLGWSLWMALSLLDWLRWGWGCFASGGIWKKKILNKAVTE